MSLGDLLLQKNADLKKLAKQFSVEAKQNSNVELRRALWAAKGQLTLKSVEIPLDKEGAKQIWDALKPQLPLYALFRSDRPTAPKTMSFTFLLQCET
jgi:hypothetical protein